MKDIEHSEHRTGYVFLLIFIVLAAGIVIGAYFTYRNYEKNYRAEIENELSSVTDLKVNQLVQWRKERLGDANIFYKNDLFSTIVKRFIQNKNDRDAKTGIIGWAGQVQRAYNYDLMMLLDAQLNTILVFPENKERARLVIDQRNTEILISGNIAFQDFYRNNRDQHIYLKILVPILENSLAKRLIAVLALRISPEEYLYPLIENWPTPSPTSETLIVRRDGNEALFLNDLKFHKDAALNFRIPLGSKDVPAVRAVLGQTGIVEGIDYRGVPVIADLRAVPDSPWFLVTRMDMEEVFAPMKERMWLMIILVGALFIGAGASVGFVWRQQSSRFYKEQYESAESLRNSETRYRRLFEAARDGILILNADTGMIVDANPFLIEMLGYTHEQFLGKKVWDLGFFKDAIANEEKFLELKQKEYMRYDDLPLETADKRKIDVEFVSNVYLADHHKVIQCNIRDITERKRAEEALRESEEKFRAFFENSSSALAIIEKDTTILMVNKEYCRMGLYEEKDVIGTSWTKQVLPEDLERLKEYNRKRLIDPKSVPDHYEFKFYRKDGVVRDSLISVAIIPSSQKIICSFTDITERKRAEEALRESEERFRTAFEYAPVGVSLTRIDGSFLRVNNAFCKMLGYSKEELLQKSFYDITPPEDIELSKNMIAKSVEDKDFISGFEKRYIGKGGNIIWVEISSSLLRDDKKQPLYFIVQTVNITERKLVGMYGELSSEILQILNEPGDIKDSIQHIIAALKTQTGSDAVGIRLQEGDDFPYILQDGFSKDFLLTENTLIERAFDGGVCRDKNGNVDLECTCGLVISGKTDPSNPLFTKGGSCWTNDSFPILDIPLSEDPRLHPRNKCIHQGYASIALVPIRTKDRIVGLIQLNDRRKGRFTLDTVELLEGIASHIGEALMRKQAEKDLHEALKERENLIRELQHALENIKTLQGLIPICANCKKIRDDKGFWNQVEGYIMEHSDATFTHGLCPDCGKKLYGNLYDKTIEKQNKKNV